MNKQGDPTHTAVLLLAFGGPRSLDEVAPFLERLMGKKPTAAQLAGLRQRYQAIGGASPLLETIMLQATALQRALTERGKPLMVFAAMRYSPPLIAETLEEIRKRGVSRIIPISLSPYHSSFTTEGYYAEVKRIISLWNDGMELVEVDNWHAHPVLCAAWAAKITEALETMGERKDAIPVIFTAHSLPIDVVANSSYVKQLEETIAGITAHLAGVSWHLAFQSRGRGAEQWLGPEPTAILEGILVEGRRQALICPIGFISDHLETLYDLDIVLKAWANKRGIEINRVPCLNDAPALIEIFVQLVERALEGEER
jgi:ferrochelatase